MAAATRILLRAPHVRPPDEELILNTLSGPVEGNLKAVAKRLVDQRPEWFVVLLQGRFFEESKDMFGEGFPIFVEVETPSGRISLFARNCQQDEQVPGSADPGSRCNIDAALKEGLDARAPSGSAATAMYFALARQLKFQVPLFVLWCKDRALAVACGASANAPAHHCCATPDSSSVDLFFFREPRAAPSLPSSLILAPTGSGKSTWRSMAPIYCPEGEVMEDVTFHPSYHKSIRLRAGGWLSSDALEIFLRDLALLIRWLRRDQRRRISFNCSGEVLAKAVELEILRPEEVVLVMPPESVHRRNLAARRAADARPEDSGSSAKKFKRDASLSQFEAGAKVNRETLLAAAGKCGVRVVTTFAAAAPAVRMYCKLRRDHAAGQPVGDPGHLTERYDVTMACGRRIHGWLHKEGQVAAEPSVWQISARVHGAEGENAYLLKALSGSLLLTDGTTLISAEDPYHETSEIFWTRAAGKTESEFLLCGRSGLQLHATVCDDCAGADAGPWPQVLPFDRLAWPTETGKATAILWYAGSFAPFHLGHLNCLRAARVGLSQKMHIAGAYVQPQPFGHLAYKKLEDKSAILGADAVRLAVLEHVISKEDWIMVDPRAVLRGKGSNLEHLKALRRNLQSAREHLAAQGDSLKSLQIIWVTGDDPFPHLREKFTDADSWHSKQMAQILQEGRFRVCVVHNRPSQRTQIDSTGLPFEVLEVDAAEEFCGDFSATALRRAFVEGADAAELGKFLGSDEAGTYLCSLPR